MEIPRLHPDTIEQVKQRADIVDVVSEHVVLRKQGKDFTGLCPFHDDKSPSFTVSPSKQFYYCFSCGAGGNAIKFMMELGKRSFSEVVLDLARRYNVSVQTLKAEERQEFQRQLSVREQLFEILALTARFFEHALNQPQGRVALDYLTGKRRLSQETIQQFQLGYAPAGWETLHGYLVEQKHFPVKLVEQAGLVVPRKEGDGYYDRFRDRLIIPIHDLQGRVVGFGGRALGDEQPKYLNSPETELFDKGKILFGLDRARAAIAKQDQAVVVEGYFDVMALHAAGVTNVVASMGTALSLHQVRQLLRYTESKRIVLNFDADVAGGKAAERAIGEVESLAYQGEVQLRVLNIPAGKDPDEYLQTHAATDYQKLLDAAPLWLDWQIQQAIAGKDLNQSDQFQQSVQTTVKLLGNLPNATLRTHYIHHCAELLSRGDSRMALRLEEDLRTQVRGERWHGRSQKWQTVGDRTLLEESEAQLLRLYLHAPQYRQEIRDALEERDLEFSFSHHRFLWRQIREVEGAGAATEEPGSGAGGGGAEEPGSRGAGEWRESGSVSPNPRLAPDSPAHGIPSDGLPASDLLAHLQDRCTDFPREMGQVYALFHLNEKTKRDILRAALTIRAATACMERVMCEKRCRHFLDLWEKMGTSVNPDVEQLLEQTIDTEQERIARLAEQERIAKSIYIEKQRIAELDRQRQVTFTDLVQTPWVGDV